MGRLTLAAVGMVILAACSSLPGVEDAIEGGNPFEDFEDAFNPDPVDISGLGDPPSAEPGTAVAEFDGQTFTYTLAGATHPQCSVDEDRFQVSMEDPNNQDLFLFDGTPSDRGDTGWQGSPSFDAGGVHHEGDSLSGHVVVDGDIVTYQGTITIVADRSDINSWVDTVGSVTANCSRPNGLPTATIAGIVHEFSLSNLDDFECEFTDERFLFELVRRAFDEDTYAGSSSDTERLSVDGRLEGDNWIGGIWIQLGPDEYNAFVPQDLAGMDVRADGATWSGTLTHTNTDDGIDEPIEGSVAFVC